jgi:hypothetical protein
MEELRDDFRLLRLLPRIVDDVHRLLSVEPEAVGEWDEKALSLWGSGGMLVPAGHNRHGRDEGFS